MNNALSSQFSQFLTTLGLASEDVQVFQALINKPSLTILEVSRLSGVNRTTCYRILESLKQKGLVEEMVDEHRRLVKAVDIHNLEFLVKEKESEAERLRELLPSLSHSISSVASQPGTKVLFYRGIEGIKQMVWNVLRTKKEGVGYTQFPLEGVAGDDFASEFYNEWVRRGLVFRDIISDTYLKYRPANKIDFGEKYFPSRYIPSSVLDITHQIDIYNDVVSYYNWHEGEIFGVEIYNDKIAAMQKQLFEVMWKIGKKQIPSRPVSNKKRANSS